MKLCPVCKAQCFDDMAVCYGCLHDFSQDRPTLPREMYGQICGEDDLEVDECPDSWVCDRIASRLASREDGTGDASRVIAVDESDNAGLVRSNCAMEVPMMTVVDESSAIHQDKGNLTEMEIVVPLKELRNGCRIVVSIA